ncbi:D-alanyl-D-alanine carboxypeptidase family protein [Antrihabitans stalactiti]|nr:D-alanyl-D-alanine carboxypeptidase family protein [Antrihabitans stalactiti]
MSARVSGVLAMTAAVLVGLGCISATAQPPDNTTTTTTTTPFTTPNTENCPNKTTPPKPIDESEVPAPGQPTPQPLPVPDKPVGGDDLGKCGSVTPSGAPGLPKEISATAWVLSDLDSGTVVAAKDPHGRYRPASTIKVLLAIVALRELDLSRTVVGTTEDADVDGTRVGIGPGGRYTNLQLMQALVMASGNDAAHAIARQLGGDEATVAKMNEMAKSLGALDTRAATPSGLDGPGMSTSAYDMALFFREAMTIPRFAELIHTEQVQFPGFPADKRIPDDKDHPAFPIGNDNQLLYNYDGALGGKTGYTDDARQTFVAGAKRDGRRLAVTLMKADVLPIRPWEQAARLLDYGFALDSTKSVGTLVEPNGSVKDDRGSVAIATPPRAPQSTPDHVGEDSHSGLIKVVVVLVGLILIFLCIGVADSINRRRQRR